jgi:radical SAM protein with 4Fe4S-binding SPASM domain
LDILPDLSVLYCWPLKSLSLPDVTRFASETDLLGRMAEMALPLREMARRGCGDCAVPPSQCQGGCLARAALEAKAFPAEKSAPA